MSDPIKAGLVNQGLEILKIQGVAVVCVLALLGFMFFDMKEDSKTAEVLERAFIRQQATVQKLLSKVDSRQYSTSMELPTQTLEEVTRGLSDEE